MILCGVVVFALAAAVMVVVMPAPLKDTDYLVIGSIATLVSLLVMFVALIATRSGTPNPFFKKRKKKLDD